MPVVGRDEGYGYILETGRYFQLDVSLYSFEGTSTVLEEILVGYR